MAKLNEKAPKRKGNLVKADGDSVPVKKSKVAAPNKNIAKKAIENPNLKKKANKKEAGEKQTAGKIVKKAVDAKPSNGVAKKAGKKQTVQPNAVKTASKKLAKFPGIGKLAASDTSPKKKRFTFKQIFDRQLNAQTDSAGKLKAIAQKIASYEAQKELSKTGKKKLSLLYRLKSSLDGTPVPKGLKPKSDKKVVKKETKGPVKQKKTPAPPKKKPVKAEDDDDDDLDEDDDDLDEDDDDFDDSEESDEDLNDTVEENKKSKNVKGNKVPLIKNGKNTQQSKGDPSKTLFVGGIGFNLTEDAIKTHFSQYGEVVKVHIPKNPGSMKSKGFCFVEYSELQSAQEALGSNQTTLGDRTLTVKSATDKPAKPVGKPSIGISHKFQKGGIRKNGPAWKKQKN